MFTHAKVLPAAFTFLIASCGTGPTKRTETPTVTQTSSPRPAGPTIPTPGPASPAPAPQGAPQPENPGADGSQTLKTSDGVTIFAIFKPAQDQGKKIALLFHQASSNLHEYDPVLTDLKGGGFDTLAIDQRSGGALWGHDNQTVKKLGKSEDDYTKALPDLRAAVDWALAKSYKTIVLVGSSYSASLTLLVGEEFSGKISGIVAFSPGEYLTGISVNAAAKAVNVPWFVTGATDEEGDLDKLLAGVTSTKLTRHKSANGIHGAATIRADENPAGAAENLAKLKAWFGTL